MVTLIARSRKSNAEVETLLSLMEKRDFFDSWNRLEPRLKCLAPYSDSKLATD